MQTQELTITRREGTGKQLAKRLRRNGVVPAVLYGGAKPETVTVDPRAVLRIIHGHEGSTQLLTLKFEGDSGSRMAIIRDLQFDPVSERLLHVDLQEVTADRAITVRVAVHPVGEAAGVKEQKGILNVVLHELDVSCLPTQIPERIGNPDSCIVAGVDGTADRQRAAKCDLAGRIHDGLEQRVKPKTRVAPERSGATRRVGGRSVRSVLTLLEVFGQ